MAKPFVFNTISQIHAAVYYFADRELEDMAGGGYTQGAVPTVIQPEQRCFFLSTGNRYPEIVVTFHAERHGSVVAQDIGNLWIGELHGVNLANIDGSDIFRKKLQGSDTIAAYMPKEIEASVALGAKPCLYAAPDWLTVRQQIFEKIFDHITAIYSLTERHGERQRPPHL
jgi:hypothetical protein